MIDYLIFNKQKHFKHMLNINVLSVFKHLKERKVF